MNRPQLLAIVALALPPAAFASEAPADERPSFNVALRSAYRGSSGVERGSSLVAWSGASFFDQSLEADAFFHPALGAEVEVARHVALLHWERTAAAPIELWDAGAGLLARADVGPLLADAHLGYAQVQLPSLVRGPGTPSTLHGPRFGLGVVARLPAGLALSARATLVLPFVALDGRGDRGDGHSSEVRVGILKRVAALAGKHVSLRLDYRHRVDALRGAAGALVSQATGNSVGLGVVVSGGSGVAP